ncbi:hypothetical protein OSB04_017686 [Centaurea solstitialis]|uniref:Uncharacterized protein n=1 Tax=Centaurea solstitialis TaxID=347529 RepID=A0AA38WM87_9ASTR|nr:hypothetical protein OSB04_017686 [Centaurea solstitialis]
MNLLEVALFAARDLKTRGRENVSELTLLNFHVFPPFSYQRAAKLCRETGCILGKKDQDFEEQGGGNSEGPMEYQRGSEWTWEPEDEMRRNNPELFRE